MTTSRDRTWWRHLPGWRHQGMALFVMAVGPLALLTLAATPAQAAGPGSAATAPFADPDPGPVLTALRVILVATTTVVAGTGLSRLLLPLSAVSRAACRTVWITAVLAVAAVVTAGVLGQASLPLTAAQVLVTLAVAAALRRAPLVMPAALGLMVLLAAELGAGSGGLTAAAETAYALGAALVSGSSVLAATSSGVDTAESRSGRAAARRLTRVAVGAGAVMVGSGVAHVVVAGPYTLVDLFHSGFGLATLAALSLPLVATGAWALAWLPSRSAGPDPDPGRSRAAGRRIADAGRIAVAGVVIAIGAVGLLATLPPPAAAPVAGRSALRPVDLAGHRLSLLVSPALPGRNLVRLGGEPALPASMPAMAMPADAPEHHHAMPAPLSISAGGAPVPIAVRPGASGGWAVLDIPAGTRQLTVSQGDSAVPVPVDVGDRVGTAEQQAVQAALAGPDGPECADAVLGALLADTSAALPTVCPSQRLDPADARSLQVMVDSLADRGTRSLSLAQDGSPRSVAAAAVVRTAAARRHLQVSGEPQADSAMVVVSGWVSAVGTLRDLTQRAASTPTATGGTYLAPWLLAGDVISVTSSSILPLRFNPQEIGPRQYAATLVSVFPDSVPSQAGYASWEQATHSISDHRVTLYGAAPVNVPMGMAMDMDTGPGEWFPGGAIVPISLALTGS